MSSRACSWLGRPRFLSHFGSVTLRVVWASVRVLPRTTHGSCHVWMIDRCNGQRTVAIPWQSWATIGHLRVWDFYRATWCTSFVEVTANFVAVMSLPLFRCQPGRLDFDDGLVTGKGEYVSHFQALDRCPRYIRAGIRVCLTQAESFTFWGWLCRLWLDERGALTCMAFPGFLRGAWQVRGTDDVRTVA
jgi:hypothetical protein